MRGTGWHKTIAPLAALLIAGCGGDGGSGADATDTDETTVAAEGDSQKGPFQQGASVTARNVLNDGAIGSQSESIATSDDRGRYQFDTLPWQGPTRIRIEGTFFDEVSGALSAESRYLDALVQVGQANGSNVNLYTHLQSGRIQTLMAEGQTFIDARSQTHQTWQALVGTQTPAEDLDILDGQSGSSESDSANLLLFSAAVLQAELDQSQLNELRDDFADDGQINGAGQTAYDAIVTAGQTDGLLADARSNLSDEFGVDPANGSPQDIAWIPSVCTQTRLKVGNARPVICTSDDPIENLTRSGDEDRVAAAVVFETPGHYRIEVSGVSGDAFGGNSWELSGYSSQDTDRLCDRFASTDATGRSTVEGLTPRMNRDEKTCLGTYYAPSPTAGGATELRVGLIPLNDGGPSLNEAVPLTVGETKAGKIGNYVTSSSDFPAYSYYQFKATNDGTYRITVNGYDNLGSGSMRIGLFADGDNDDVIRFLNEQDRVDFTGGPGTDATETVLETTLGAGTYGVRVFNGTGYRATTEGAPYQLTSLTLNIRVEDL